MHDFESSIPILPDWLVLDCPPLSVKDLSTIVVRRWPQLGSVRDRLVSLLGLPCWLELPPGHRKPNPRALFKLCERANNYYVAGNAEYALRLFQDAVDLMCGSLPKSKFICTSFNCGNRRYLIDGFYIGINSSHCSIMVVILYIYNN